MTRGKWVIWGAAIIVCLILVDQVAVGQIGTKRSFQPERLNDAQFVVYKKKLNAILKTRLVEEKAFVDEVADKQRAGKIPAKLVTTSWRWASHHRPDTKYPFVYFEHILRLQATRIGLGDEVPPFDYGIYSNSTRQRR